MRKKLVPLAVAALLTTVAGTKAVEGAESVTGVVFEDRNGDGIRQPSEAGVANVVVSNQIDAAQSAADGSFRLNGRGYGVVFVSVPRGRNVSGGFWRALPAGDTATADFGLTAAPTDSDDFTFIHASDTHIHEETVARTRGLLGVVAARKPDFMVVTGDLIRDALRVGEADASRLYELYVKEMKASASPVWSGPGNHENFGIERHHSLVSAKHPLFGKGMYRKYLGPNYYSFNRGKVHFIALDTVDIDDLWYYGHVDQAQLDWLAKDLALVPKGTTVVTFNHIPFFSGRMPAVGYTDGGAAPTLIRIGDKTKFRHIVSNAGEVLSRLKDHRYALSLAGHNHAFERVLLSPLPGATRFHLTAAVIGPTNDVVASPSGVTLYRVKGDVIDDGEFVEIPPAPPVR